MKNLRSIVLRKRFFIYLTAAVIVSGCATYYSKNIKLFRAIETGQFAAANKQLERDTKGAQGRNSLLHFLNRGYVSMMLNENHQSIQFFNTAERMIDEQMRINVGAEALALITNPMVRPYRAEDFEVVMVNCFKAINFMQIGQYESSLVESRRINIKLNQLNDRHANHKNRYQNDAFAHTMMGLVYDANGDYNNAFIAYRNAYNVYENDYATNFDVQPPRQLQRDILRTAHLMGFREELDFFEQKFGMRYTHAASPEAELVFFWFNGFGPVKDEWSVNFTAIKGQGGNFTFVNEELGFSFTFPLGASSEEEDNLLANLKIVRVAFPKYVERRPRSIHAVIRSDVASYPLERAQDINAIAFKTLNDRFMREMASTLLRVATKQALEHVARKEDKSLGSIIGIVNAATEKADTRNWQSLPNAISYTRVPLRAGDNRLTLNVSMVDGRMIPTDVSMNAQRGKTYFQVFHTLN